MNSNYEYSGESAPEPSSPFNFKLFFAKVVRNWYWLLISTLTLTAYAIYHIRSTTPVYHSSLRLLFNPEESRGGESALISQLRGGSVNGASLANEALMLTTRSLMERVVTDLDANISYYVEGKLRPVEIYKPPFAVKLLNTGDTVRSFSGKIQIQGTSIHIYNDNLSKTVKFYQPFSLPGVGDVQIERREGALDDTEYTFVIQSARGTAAGYVGKLTIQPVDKQTTVLELGFDSPLPLKSEKVLKQLVFEYIRQSIDAKNRISDSTIAFIENRLQLVGAELGSIEGNVEDFKQRNKLTDINQKANMLVSSNSQYSEELVRIETQLSVLDATERYLRDEKDNERVLPSATLIEDGTFAGLIGRYNTLVQEKERSSLSQTPNNPYIQNLNDQIDNVRGDMLRSLNSLRKTLIISRNRLSARNQMLEGQVRNVPTIERKYLDLARQQQIKQQLYLFLLQKREEAAISKTSNIANCKIVDGPTSSFAPISPNSAAILLCAIAGGLLIPILLIYIGTISNSKVLTKDDILAVTQAPIIAEVGGNKSDEAVVVSRDLRSAIAEQIRNLRTNLAFFLKEGEKTILMTSSTTGEGKSFIALNLGNALALSGKKVLLMEMDLRRPNLSNKLNLVNDHGFTSFVISQDMAASDIIKSTGINDNLFIISSGPVPPNPSETILDSRLDALMDELKLQFDYIIIDAPPVGIVTDAQLLSKFCDLTLYVIRQRYTRKEQLAIAQDIFYNRKMKKLALVVNDVDGAPGYGYNYSYGSYDSAYKQAGKKSLIKRLFS